MASHAQFRKRKPLKNCRYKHLNFYGKYCCCKKSGCVFAELRGVCVQACLSPPCMKGGEERWEKVFGEGRGECVLKSKSKQRSREREEKKRGDGGSPKKSMHTSTESGGGDFVSRLLHIWKRGGGLFVLDVSNSTVHPPRRLPSAVFLRFQTWVRVCLCAREFLTWNSGRGGQPISSTLAASRRFRPIQGKKRFRHQLPQFLHRYLEVIYRQEPREKRLTIGCVFCGLKEKCRDLM